MVKRMMVGLIVGYVLITSGLARGEDLSLGKPYSFAPLTSYPACTDEGDAVQLTTAKSSSPAMKEQCGPQKEPWAGTRLGL